MHSQNTTQTHSPGFTMPTYVLEPLPEVEREKTGLPKVYDVQDGICILGAAGSTFLYLNRGGNHDVCLYIFSQTELDCETISAWVDVMNAYNVSVEKIELEGITPPTEEGSIDQSTRTQFPYALYQAYQGKDFRKLAELTDKVDQLYNITASYDALLLNEKITKEEYDTLMKPYFSARAEYQVYMDAEKMDYLNLEKTDLPEFHVYQLFINFSYTREPIEEVFTEVEVTIGGKHVTYPVGPVTLGKLDLPGTIDWYVGDGENVDDGILGSGNAPLPYNDGIHWINSYFSFHADQYKSLQRIVLDNPCHQLDRVWVSVRQPDGYSSITEWDMQEPFDVFPGDDVTIYISYRDSAVNDLGYATNVWGFLEYETDGKLYSKISQCQIDVSLNYYAIYALIFDGIDMEEYYWDYYYLLRESWRFDSTKNPAWWD